MLFLIQILLPTFGGFSVVMVKQKDVFLFAGANCFQFNQPIGVSFQIPTMQIYDYSSDLHKQNQVM